MHTAIWLVNLKEGVRKIHQYKDNIKMDVREIGRWVLNWIR